MFIVKLCISTLWTNGLVPHGGACASVSWRARPASAGRRSTTLREGLLPSAEKVNARPSYFDDGHLARLRLIKAFQQAHTPLARIREQIEGLSRYGLPETPAVSERALALGHRVPEPSVPRH